MIDDSRDLIPAWALDAVDEDERARIEALLAADPEARAEADAMRESAAYLALADDAVSEPVDGGVWNRIVEATGGTAGESADAMAAGLRMPDTAAPVELAAHRRSRRPAPVLLLAGIAAAVALVFVVGISIGRTQSPSVSAEAALWADAQKAGKVVTLTKDNQPVARVGLLPDGTAVLHNETLPALPDGKTYQLWAVSGPSGNARVISAGVLGSSVTNAPISIAGSPNAFVLTVEDAPGVAVSSQPALASGAVS